VKFRNIFYALFLFVLSGAVCSTALGSKGSKKNKGQSVSEEKQKELLRLCKNDERLLCQIKELVKSKYLNFKESRNLFFAIFNNISQYAKIDGKSKKERIAWAKKK